MGPSISLERVRSRRGENKPSAGTPPTWEGEPCPEVGGDNDSLAEAVERANVDLSSQVSGFIGPEITDGGEEDAAATSAGEKGVGHTPPR